ncbi:MAG: hypothetical protein WC531_00635 [Candidatus Paceibacterota bacterium]|jgi:hypothetical protein
MLLGLMLSAVVHRRRRQEELLFWPDRLPPNRRVEEAKRLLDEMEFDWGEETGSPFFQYRLLLKKWPGLADDRITLDLAKGVVQATRRKNSRRIQRAISEGRVSDLGKAFAELRSCSPDIDKIVNTDEELRQSWFQARAEILYGQVLLAEGRERKCQRDDRIRDLLWFLVGELVFEREDLPGDSLSNVVQSLVRDFGPPPYRNK